MAQNISVGAQDLGREQRLLDSKSSFPHLPTSPIMERKSRGSHAEDVLQVVIHKTVCHIHDEITSVIPRLALFQPQRLVPKGKSASRLEVQRFKSSELQPCSINHSLLTLAQKSPKGEHQCLLFTVTVPILRFY
ncbi:hypothetical protein E4U43_008109 [Claviceps pusilla]|uniref:Uncharacterized protein n=1 Tax=Claviceps pusilla TaxID=123648 RepID=A0A9P7SYJ5_9HYPO|nr:hypothetical protein E4U43_008109 [Claviceps pusilla]